MHRPSPCAPSSARTSQDKDLDRQSPSVSFDVIDKGKRDWTGDPPVLRSAAAIPLMRKGGRERGASSFCRRATRGRMRRETARWPRVPLRF
ncbi:hypothetical protein COCON_G00035960 [Conger conger]|uniref:Uncharacterized protein n=1 Tax=Conger conger TaxID=82655 RepID=A0A9Q1I7M5_CONCO|nr:hypothetical protein COCON_G00035960 [Conger conger]